MILYKLEILDVIWCRALKIFQMPIRDLTSSCFLRVDMISEL